MNNNELGNAYELQEFLLGWHEIDRLSVPQRQGSQSSPCLPSLEESKEQESGWGGLLMEITFFLSIVPTGCERKIEHPLRPECSPSLLPQQGENRWA